jgi:hypothetical protein
MTTEDTGIVFVHVPKAAGSSLSWLLRRRYGANFLECSSVDLEDGLAPIEDFEWRRTGPGAIAGHLGTGINLALRGQPLFVTILRNPVDRIISYYYYARETPAHYLHDQIVGGGLTLAEFVQCGLTLEIDNLQVRQFSGETGRVNHSPFGELSSEALNTAKERLADFDLVGLSEDFAGTMVCLRKLTGWCRVYSRRMNVTRCRTRLEEISRETLDLVRRSQALDIELYEFGRALFARQVEDYGPKFEKDRSRFSSWNSRFSRVCELGDDFYNWMVDSFPYRLFYWVKYRFQRKS